MNKTHLPILIFPWDRPFLADLKNILTQADAPANSVIIVPNRRPWRYFLDLYKSEHGAHLPPKMLTLEDTVSYWRSSFHPVPKHTAKLLDQVALLRDCVGELAKEDQILAEPFAKMDLANFLPWGIRLAKLLDEIFSQGLEPEDLGYLGDDLAPQAAALMSALGRIGKKWRNVLEQERWTTPGLNLFTVAQHSHKIPAMLKAGTDRPVFIAGFYALTDAEDKILRSLWEAGAQVCLHTDPALARHSSQHWACREHEVWIRRWQAKAELATPASYASKENSNKLHFFAAYDCHSQLAELRDRLQNTPEEKNYASTAVVLADNSLLLPVLHHLPQKNVNISMGYPLTRSPLAQLLEDIFKLQAGKTKDGLYYWRDLLRVLRHPYLQMLSADPKGETASLRPGLQALISDIRRGQRYVKFESLLNHEHLEKTPESFALMKKCLNLLIKKAGEIRTTGELAQLLAEFCDFLIDNGAEIWKRFPLDAEGIFRIQNNLLTALNDNLLSSESLPLSTLHSILQNLLEQERIPFEADPLVGIQVLGMLETRLLHFERVLILDATEDKLPGIPSQDPLLPDSLRHLLGLPDSHRRQSVVAHTLYRLCAGAEEVHFFWQEGVNRSSLFAGKKNRSPFVDELLWQEEKRQGAIINSENEMFKVATCQIRPAPRKIRPLECSGQLRQRLNLFLNDPLTASNLDIYLQCPLRFARQCLLRIAPPEEQNDGDDPAAVGTFIHGVMQRIFTPWLGRELHAGELDRDFIFANFIEELEKSELRERLPAHSYLMLESAGPFQLAKFLDHQPERTFILALERSLNVKMTFFGRDYTFKGTIDRLDRRDGRLYVLDYKTGRVKSSSQELWEDENFFGRIENACNDQALAKEKLTPDLFLSSALHERLDEMREMLPSIQLPCYLSMLATESAAKTGNAAWVDLGNKGTEIPIFPEMEDPEHERALKFCNQSLGLILRHLELTPIFEPRSGSQCQWCDYSALCGI